MEFGEWKKSMETEATLENKELKKELERLKGENNKLKNEVKDLKDVTDGLLTDCEKLANRCRVFTGNSMCIACGFKEFNCKHDEKHKIAIGMDREMRKRGQ